MVKIDQQFHLTHNERAKLELLLMKYQIYYAIINSMEEG